jgi:hypothetical protein
MDKYSDAVDVALEKACNAIREGSNFIVVPSKNQDTNFKDIYRRLVIAVCAESLGFAYITVEGKWYHEDGKEVLYDKPSLILYGGSNYNKLYNLIRVIELLLTNSYEMLIGSNNKFTYYFKNAFTTRVIKGNGCDIEHDTACAVSIVKHRGLNRLDFINKG